MDKVDIFWEDHKIQKYDKLSKQKSREYFFVVFHGVSGCLP